MLSSSNWSSNSIWAEQSSTALGGSAGCVFGRVVLLVVTASGMSKVPQSVCGAAMCSGSAAGTFSSSSS